MTPEQKQKIDSMTHEQLAWVWRFTPLGDDIMCGAAGDYLRKKFEEKGGMTVTISKKLDEINE